MRCSILPVAFAALLGVRGSVERPEEYVNILQGTMTRFNWSQGNTLPLVGTPWGQNYWAPESPMLSSMRSNWYFNPKVPRIKAIRCTHQPSPWINEWGTFSYQFGMGQTDGDISQGYDPIAATWKPYHFGAEILGMSTKSGGHTQLDLTASSHGSALRFIYPEVHEDIGFDQTRWIALDRSRTAETFYELVEGPDYVVVKSFTDQANGGIENKDKYRLRYAAKVSPKPEVSLEYDPEDPARLVRVIFTFDSSVGMAVVKTGLSLISYEDAVARLDDELDGTWEDIMSRNKEIWQRQLAVVDIVDTGFPIDLERNLLVTFYTSLYRASLFPRNLGEPKNRNEYHWSPYDKAGGVFEGPLMTDSGFWDAYHTIYTIQGLLWPDQLETTMDGYVNAFREGGWCPQWSSPSYRSSMVGSMSDVAMADAIVKGFRNFDVEGALQSMKKNAFSIPGADEPNRGRGGIADFRELGFVARDSKNRPEDDGTVHEVVSRTLYHSMCDYAILQAINATGTIGTTVFSQAEIKALEIGALSHQNIWHEENKYYQAKWRTGEWVENFDSLSWGGDYTEGGPKQFRHAAPHDMTQMISNWGRVGDFCKSIDDMNTEPSYFRKTPWNYGGNVIHEMLEMPLNVWGQYSHNNQPMHHVQYLPLLATNFGGREECVRHAQYWIKKTLLMAYDPFFLSGDEDNGEMGAWFVLSALGIYDPMPGTPEYVIGIPLFKHARISAKGLKLDIKTDDDWCPLCGASGVAKGEGASARSVWSTTLPELREMGTMTFATSGPLPALEAETEGDSGAFARMVKERTLDLPLRKNSPPFGQMTP